MVFKVIMISFICYKFYQSRTIILETTVIEITTTNITKIYTCMSGDYTKNIKDARCHAATKE